MQTEPLVSIVLPTYNRQDVLKDAIASIICQTFTDFELIVVDDCSPDNTEEVVREFDDSRIRYLRNAQNQRLPKSLNIGFRAARGKFLTWTSDDNMYLPDAVATMVGAMKEGADFVYSDYLRFQKTDDAGTPVDVELVQLQLPEWLSRKNCIGACFMYTREVYETIGDYDPELFLVEDYDYWIRVSQRFPMRHIPQALYCYRSDEHTLSAKRGGEVFVSDLLLRLRHEFMNVRAAVRITSRRLVTNSHVLSNPFLRFSQSGRIPMIRILQRLRAEAVRSVLLIQLARNIAPLLRAYRTGERGFSQTRDEFLATVASMGSVTPRQADVTS